MQLVRGWGEGEDFFQKESWLWQSYDGTMYLHDMYMPGYYKWRKCWKNRQKNYILFTCHMGVAKSARVLTGLSLSPSFKPQHMQWKKYALTWLNENDISNPLVNKTGCARLTVSSTDLVPRSQLRWLGKLSQKPKRECDHPYCSWWSQ